MRIAVDHDFKSFDHLVNIPNRPDPQSPYFHDVMALRAGVEVELPRRGAIGWIVRGGYGFEPSPVPDQFAETSFADSDKHVLAAGVGAVIDHVPFLPRPLTVDAHLNLTLLPSRTTEKLRPLDPVGDFESSGYLFATGITTRFSF